MAPGPAPRLLPGLTSGLAAGLAAASFVAPPAAGASAPTPTCRGEAATLVVDEPGFTEGTEGPDVIVVQEAGARVNALGGDDLMCIDAAERTMIDAGAGDDLVEVRDRSSYYWLTVHSLGPGDDTFLGGPGADRYLGDQEDPSPEAGGSDTIHTGGGNDQVRIGGRSTPHLVDVDLGAGDDRLSVTTDPVAPGSVLRGGPGRDELSARATRVALDAAALTVELVDDGGTASLAGWTSFEAYTVVGQVGTVRGTSGPDRVTMQTYGRVDVRTGGGRDVITFGDAARGWVRGGTGRDLLVRENISDPTTIDLRKGTLVEGQRGRRSLRLAGLEDVTATGSVGSTVVGDRRDNRIRLTCGTASGGPGDDTIVEHTPPRYRPDYFPDGCQDHVARGGRGDDVLVGSPGPDRLYGGPGRDVARGRGARDLCRAERVRDC
ncbi:MAG: hypothetical protein CMH83_05715 [Nocardioides sp.]|nr:hypothetical protein [Nocardioides sp.]